MASLKISGKLATLIFGRAKRTALSIRQKRRALGNISTRKKDMNCNQAQHPPSNFNLSMSKFKNRAAYNAQRLLSLSV